MPIGAARAGGSSGGKETRTPDPLHAMQMLYQLSYAPAPCVPFVAPGGEPVVTKDTGDSAVGLWGCRGRRANQPV